MQNQNTITKIERKVLFPLGQIFLTVAQDALEESNQNPIEFLAKHFTGNWGDVCKEDAQENELSIKEGFRILSACKTKLEERIWIITEANRETTTILLPEEY